MGSGAWQSYPSQQAQCNEAVNQYLLPVMQSGHFKTKKLSDLSTAHMKKNFISLHSKVGDHKIHKIRIPQEGLDVHLKCHYVLQA